LDIEFCRGSTEGSLRFGANVPEQAIQMVVHTLAAGGDVNAAWNQASITPSVRGSIRSGRWKVELNAQTSVDSSGHDTSVSGGVSVSTDVAGHQVTVGGTAQSQDVGGNHFGGASGSLTVTIDLDQSPPPAHCTTQHVRSGFNYECTEEQDVAPTTIPGTQLVTNTDERIYNLFFLYARPDFDELRNRQSLASLVGDLTNGSGFQVARIAGFASPEGPMQASANGFMGNTELSNKRAEAARRRISDLCSQADCFDPNVQVIGLGERMDPQDETGQPQDVSGQPLEQHVDENFPTDPNEATVRNPALLERLRRAHSQHARAELIYPELRRAIVTLRKSATHTDPCSTLVPGGTREAYLPGCPPEILQAAFPGAVANH
jgi:hypothetical protein